MKFVETPLKGAYMIDIERLEDERGFFARMWCREEFAGFGLSADFVQSSISFSKVRGTLRGMYYQAQPYEEAKLVYCARGSIYDVIIDLRPSSPTYKKWTAVELSQSNKRLLYIPTGFAHGFQTLEDCVEVVYHMSEFHAPGYARGIRWNDPGFNIEWPIHEPILSSRDRSFVLYKA